MSALLPIQIAEQQRLNRSINVSDVDSAMFKLLLSMAQNDLSKSLKIADLAHELPINDTLSSHYRNAAFKYTDQDYAIQAKYQSALAQQDFCNLRLLCYLHPQGLSEFDDPMVVPQEVIQNSSYQAIQDNKQAEAQPSMFEIEPQPTLLYDLLEALQPSTTL